MCVISVREVVIKSLLIGSPMATYLLILRLEMNSLLMIHIFQQKRRVEIVKNDDHIEFHVTLVVAALWDSISTIFWTRKHSFFCRLGGKLNNIKMYNKEIQIFMLDFSLPPLFALTTLQFFNIVIPNRSLT